MFVSSALFVLTGLVQTVCIQAVLYSGGGDRSTFLLALPNYIGIVFVSFFGARVFRLLDNLGVWASRGNELNRFHMHVYTRPPKHVPQLPFLKRLFHRDRRKLFVLAFNELGGFLTGLTGLSIAGSGLYQVVFSGATVFTALLTTVFLRKRLSVAQWMAVAVITFGLMITAEQVTRMPAVAAAGGAGAAGEEANDAGAASIISGLAFVLVSCLFYSTNYVIAEHVLTAHTQPSPATGPGPSSATHPSDADPSSTQSLSPPTTIAATASASAATTGVAPMTPTLPPPSGLDLSLYTGGSCLMFFSVYVLAHTVPNWHQLVTSSIERHHGNTTLIMEYYVYLFVASFVHAVTHYDVLATIGAVPIGVLNALRAVSVFAASSWLFCSHQASQCFSYRKGISTAIVIGGALAYSAASSPKVPMRTKAKTKKKKTLSTTAKKRAHVLLASSSSTVGAGGAAAATSASVPLTSAGRSLSSSSAALIGRDDSAGSNIQGTSRYKLSVVGRKFRKAMSTYIGFAPRFINPVGPATTTTTTTTLTATTTTAAGTSITALQHHMTSTSTSSQSGGAGSQSPPSGSTTIPLLSASNPDGWSSSLKKANPGIG